MGGHANPGGICGMLPGGICPLACAWARAYRFCIRGMLAGSSIGASAAAGSGSASLFTGFRIVFCGSGATRATGAGRPAPERTSSKGRVSRQRPHGGRVSVHDSVHQLFVPQNFAAEDEFGLLRRRAVDALEDLLYKGGRGAERDVRQSAEETAERSRTSLSSRTFWPFGENSLVRRPLAYTSLTCSHTPSLLSFEVAMLRTGRASTQIGRSMRAATTPLSRLVCLPNGMGADGGRFVTDHRRNIWRILWFWRFTIGPGFAV
eukprot:scaffold1667_cov258-Pinguiococcus_pyrenoidosus.AAC.15